MTEHAGIDFENLPIPRDGFLVTEFITVRNVARSRASTPRCELVAVEPPPALLGGIEQLVSHREGGLLGAGALGDSGAEFDGRDLDSITLLVRRWRQCSAGKS